MDDFDFGFLADIEDSFGDVPELDRRTFALICHPLLIQTGSGPVFCLAFPLPVLAQYRGGVRGYVGCQVEILGRCDCDFCHLRREHGTVALDKPMRYVARVSGTTAVLSHSRAQSYELPGI